MKACIIGAGALGSIFTYFFSKNCLEFVIYEKNNAVVEAIKKGLTIETEEGEYLYHPDISSNASIIRGCDLIFLFVKSYSTEQTIKDIEKYSDEDSIIVSLQNGLGNYDIINKTISSNRIVYGTTTIGATKTSLASVKAGGMGAITIGCRSGNNVQKVAKYLKLANIETEITDNPELAVWEKAIINAGINPIASLLHFKNGQILQDIYATKLQRDIIHESIKVAETKGIFLDPKIMIEKTQNICAKTSENICSMLQDITFNRKTEIESINGKIADYGDEENIHTPCNRTLYLLIKTIEKHISQY